MVVLNRDSSYNDVTLHLSNVDTKKVRIIAIHLSTFYRESQTNIDVTWTARSGTFQIVGGTFRPGMHSLVVEDDVSLVELVNTLAFVTESGNVTADFDFTQYQDALTRTTSYLPT